MLQAGDNGERSSTVADLLLTSRISGMNEVSIVSGCVSLLERCLLYRSQFSRDGYELDEHPLIDVDGWRAR